MSEDDIRAILLDDLNSRGTANVHELAINNRLIHVRFSEILAHLYGLLEAGIIELAEYRGIGAGGRVRLAGAKHDRVETGCNNRGYGKVIARCRCVLRAGW